MRARYGSPISEIADGEGRTVLTHVEAISLDASVQLEVASALARANAIAALIEQARPAHWLASGRHVALVQEPGEGVSAIALTDADDWRLSTAYGIATVAGARVMLSAI